ALISFVPIAMISSTIALAGFILANDVNLGNSFDTWVVWWLADATGTLIIAPVVVLWAVTPLRPISKWSLSETVAVIVLATAIGIIAFSPLFGKDSISSNLNGLLPYRSLVGFLVLLPLMWAGLRGNQRNVATAAFIFCGIAVWGLSAGSRPFLGGDLNESLLVLFVLSMSTTVASHFGRSNCHAPGRGIPSAFYARPVEP